MEILFSVKTIYFILENKSNFNKIKIFFHFSKIKGFKDTLKAYNDFKNKQQKCMKQFFLYVKKVYIFRKLFNTLYNDAKTNVFKMFLNVINFVVLYYKGM